MKITFITGNPGKAEWLAKHLKHKVAHQKLELLEIQSLDLEEIIEHKTKEAYAKLKRPVMVEDASLIFNAMGRLPGTFIKFFLEELGNEGLCRLLDGFNDRSAIAEVCYGIYDGKNLVKFKRSKIGSIAKSPRGTKGMGFDPFFIPEGQTKTWGEMEDDEIENNSLRIPLYRKMEKFLKNEN
jgi:inosine triphosphate pyrophosphatase